MVITGGLLGALIIVASAFIAFEAKRYSCRVWNCRMVDATAVSKTSRLIIFIGMMYTAYFHHVLNYQRSKNLVPLSRNLAYLEFFSVKSG